MSDPASTPEVSSDEAAVVASTLDYFQAWFDGDDERMDRVLHPALAKRSLTQAEPESAELRSVTKNHGVARHVAEPRMPVPVDV